MIKLIKKAIFLDESSADILTILEFVIPQQNQQTNKT